MSRCFKRETQFLAPKCVAAYDLIHMISGDDVMFRAICWTISQLTDAVRFTASNGSALDMAHLFTTYELVIERVGNFEFDQPRCQGFGVVVGFFL